MNKIRISKKGFFQDLTWLDDPMGLKMDCLYPSKDFIDQYQLVMTILVGKPLPKEVRLHYPEKFYPRNMGQYFWKKVETLMSAGLLVEVETSDITAACFVSGWDEKTIQSSGPDGVWQEHALVDTYGRDVASVAKENPF